MSLYGEPRPHPDQVARVQDPSAPPQPASPPAVPAARGPATYGAPAGGAGVPGPPAGTTYGATYGTSLVGSPDDHRTTELAPDGPPPGGPAGWPARLTAAVGRRRGLVAAGVVVALLVAAGSTTAAYAYAGDVPRGTTALGVDLGGKSRSEAADALRAKVTKQTETPVTVQVGEQSAQIKPADVGLTVDVDATIAAATAARPGPLSRLFGSRTVEPVVNVDAAKLDAALRTAVGKDAQTMTMPAVLFEDTTPKPVYPKPGRNLDPERSAQAVRDGWLSGQSISVPLVDVHPATTAEELDKLVAEFAKPAVSAPVTVTTDKGSMTVPPKAIAASLVLIADEAGKINPRLDDKKLRAAITDQLPKVEAKPKDATVSIEGDTPKVNPSTDGHELDTTALSKDLLPVLPKPDAREVKGVLKPLVAKTTTEQVGKLGIKERVSTYTTYFTGGLSSPRSQNIVQAAKEVDGAVVKPGEVFSLNKHTGERSYAQGYKDAPVILGGKLVPGVGGGVSQFTTTLFNASYYAGLEDVEHTPHSYYFSRYPSVIESTIFYPDLDFKFRNDTPYGVVIDTSYSANSITVSMWSTKVYDKVVTEWSERRNITEPKVTYLEPGPKCIATDGLQGFTQDAYRIFHKDGKQLKREKFSWKYDPEPRFICGPKP